ncbi:hypothetical protein OIDMADRAFT_33556 [Oidiodendron maius Zn]|uniref:Uncharacterized protein n=1 Tax=Oidiodendron maius (strain Zn) TaxID=913774 RepID=A0A0C3GYB9_OIDMZ|nr:hypothetical protein OIDMADRAFT_33556 [Oidiodendron maius Zn]
MQERTFSSCDQVLTAVDGPHEIPPWLPHTFWPAPSSTEDTVFLLWAHPDNVHQAMDRIFFTNLLLYFSDIHEKRVSLNPFQIMLMQHNSSTTSVWFPTVTWLGPLRWWVPWVVQASFAAVGRLAGMAPVMEKYTSKEDWEMIRNAKDG